MNKVRQVKKPRISVIIPTYNEEKYITACLKSLVHQNTQTPFEIIVVDNNSTDRTSNIGKQFGVRVIKENKQGRAFARNAGVKVALGSILAFSEADCVVPNNWITTINRTFREYPGIVGFSGSLLFSNAPFYCQLFGPAMIKFSSPLYKLFWGTHVFRGANFAIRKSAINQTSGFNSRAAPFDDMELSFRLSKIGPIAFLADFYVTASDRRFRGRFLQTITEFLNSYPRIFIFNLQGTDNLYQVIR